MHCTFAAWATLSCSDTHQIIGSIFVLFLLVVLLFYPFVMRPSKEEKLQKEKQKELEKLLSNSQCKNCRKKHPN